MFLGRYSWFVCLAALVSEQPSQTGTTQQTDSEDGPLSDYIYCSCDRSCSCEHSSRSWDHFYCSRDHDCCFSSRHAYCSQSLACWFHLPATFWTSATAAAAGTIFSRLAGTRSLWCTPDNATGHQPPAKAADTWLCGITLFAGWQCPWVLAGISRCSWCESACCEPACRESARDSSQELREGHSYLSPLFLWIPLFLVVRRLGILLHPTAGTPWLLPDCYHAIDVTYEHVNQQHSGSDVPTRRVNRWTEFVHSQWTWNCGETRLFRISRRTARLRMLSPL